MILEQTLPQCNCTRGIESFGKSISGQSSCSKPALARGSHQKVIAFTFFVGPTFDKLKRDYLAGIEKNFLNMQSMYGSEWVMRLYYNIQGNQELLDHICSLACFKSNIELCDLAEKNENFDMSAISNATVHIDNIAKVYPLVWRFFPILDQGNKSKGIVNWLGAA